MRGPVRLHAGYRVHVGVNELDLVLVHVTLQHHVVLYLIRVLVIKLGRRGRIRTDG